MPPVANSQSWWSVNRTVVLISWAVFALVLVLSGMVQGDMPMSIGRDSDDVMRFVQLRDLLEGQGWRDTSQWRLGPDGTPLHWSRLADLPFLIVAWPLSHVLGVDMALRVAGTVVPPLLSLLFVVGMLRGVSALLGQARLSGSAVLVAAMLAAISGYKFGMGKFDHHHLQIGLFALAFGLTLVRTPTKGEAAVAGASIAACAVVGLEAAPQLVVLCAIWALLWALDARSDDNRLEGGRAQDSRTQPTLAFGVALALTSLLGLGLMTGRTAVQGPVCDAFGAPVGGLLVLGGAGLAALAALPLMSSSPLVARLQPLPVRVAALIGLGAAAAAALLLGAPDCAANPMAALSQDVQDIWLSRVREAVPLHRAELSMKAEALGPALSALAVAIWGVRKSGAKRRGAYLIAGGMVVLGVIMTAYQVRFSTFTMVSAVTLLGAMVVTCLDAPPSLRSRGGLVLAALATQVVVWGALANFADVMMRPSEVVQEADQVAIAGIEGADVESLDIEVAGPAQAEGCTTPFALAVLDTLPSGMVFTSLNVSPHVLLHTRHSAFASNYHRGWRDIDTLIAITRADMPDAVGKLREHGVTYLYACRSEEGLMPAIYLDDDSPLYTAIAQDLGGSASVSDQGLRRMVMDPDGRFAVYAVE